VKKIAAIHDKAFEEDSKPICSKAKYNVRGGRAHSARTDDKDPAVGLSNGIDRKVAVRRNAGMSKAIETLESAMKRAMAGRPKVGGFPYLAETLRRAGVKRNLWSLPSCQILYRTNEGAVVYQGAPLITGMSDVAAFNREALIVALRTDQRGESTFPEFLTASWRAGVVRYDVDLDARTVAYYGWNDEEYVEEYPLVDVKE
jgi:uncharacterized protein YbcV (DUF1398 family)